MPLVDPFRSLTGIISRSRKNTIAGGAAGNHTLTGIDVNLDRILKVTHLPANTVTSTSAVSELNFHAGTHVVTAAEDTAATLVIDTDLEEADAIHVWVETSAGVHDARGDLAISETRGVLTVADGAATTDVDATDVIHWMLGGTTGADMASGTHTVTAGEDTAGTLDIVTGLSSISGYVLMVLTAGGANDPITDLAVSEAAGTITVADGAATDAVDSTDVIHWFAVGTAPTGWAAGTHTITAGEDTAGTLDIDTGLTTVTGYQIMILTAAGAYQPLVDAAISVAGGTITVADGAATFTADATDVIHYIATESASPGAVSVITSSAVQGAPADLTSEFSITAANTINNTGGTATTGGWLEVEWYDHDYGELTNPAWIS